jgi:hypothetical protein
MIYPSKAQPQFRIAVLRPGLRFPAIPRICNTIVEPVACVIAISKQRLRRNGKAHSPQHAQLNDRTLPKPGLIIAARRSTGHMTRAAWLGAYSMFGGEEAATRSAGAESADAESVDFRRDLFDRNARHAFSQ